MNLETVERNSRKFVLVPIEQYNQSVKTLKAIAEALEVDLMSIL